MEENFEEFNKNYKGKRSVKYQISGIKENRKVLIVNYKEYSDKIVNISELWVLWYERQRPRGRNSKSSILILINKADNKYFINICIKNIETLKLREILTEIEIKSKIKVTAVFIRAHSRRRLRTKESNRINKPTLIRRLQAYPAYIRSFVGISILVYTRPNRIFQAYPA